MSEQRQRLREARASAYVQSVVASAPPLTRHQQVSLAALLLLKPERSDAA